MAFRVAFHPIAEADLFGLYSYIEEHSGPARAGSYLDRIEALCMSLGDMPTRGVDRRDLGPNIRTVSLERRVLVIYRATFGSVEILRILYAGRDYSADDVPR